MKNLTYLLIALVTWSSGSRADQPSVHGMLLFGNQATYASHLPMFHSPHDYQLLLKLTLKDQSGAKTLASYEEAKKNATEYFTLVPEVMDLTKVMSGAKTSFSASIFKGHFERGGQKLGAVQVEVEKIIFSSTLNGQAVPTDNKYFVFGGNGEYFAAHLIQGKPNYDAIVTVSQPYKLNHSICKKRFCPEPDSTTVADSQLPLILSAEAHQKVPAVGESLGEFSGVLADLIKVIYVEEGELSH